MGALDGRDIETAVTRSSLSERHERIESSRGWTGPNYAVAYAVGTSPFGPFERVGRILQQDSTVATGAGHHSALHVPGSSKWYIVYHRRPLGQTDRNHRVVSIDELRSQRACSFQLNACRSRSPRRLIDRAAHLQREHLACSDVHEREANAELAVRGAGHDPLSVG